MCRIPYRFSMIVFALLSQPACTAMLLGGGAASESTPRVARDSASVARDDAISGQVRQRLQADAELGRYSIGVGTEIGIVTLGGTVGSYAARDRAVQVARNTPGVRRVENRLVVNTNL